MTDWKREAVSIFLFKRIRVAERFHITGYQLNPEKNIWSKPGYNGINYSDGDEVEDRIDNIIGQASDITSLSSELQQYCKDWPSLYHLSGMRANIVRPIVSGDIGDIDILEIGAGCGAITRYLGECGAHVLALEGSLRRAAIARSRTRDLGNVTVLADTFKEFQCDHRFDVITLIGVLEYANLFIDQENPAVAMLERVLGLLKPKGKLIVAIENQLGLKYFAGAPEDHVGQPMYGIEGRYRKDQPHTYGRAVLAEIVQRAGFRSLAFLAPFPDYKLPISVITEAGFNSKDFDASALAWQTVRRDPQLPRYFTFSPELVWPFLFQNGIALEMANSFIVVASPDPAGVFLAPDILAFQYSTDRRAAYCKETVFRRTKGGDIEVANKGLGVSGAVDEDGSRVVIFNIPDTTTYSVGVLFSRELLRIVTSDGWSVEQVGVFLRDYIAIVESLIKKLHGKAYDTVTLATRLPGLFFDAIPANIIIKNDGTAALIDREWSYREPVELGYLLFRTLHSAIAGCSVFAKNSDGVHFTRKSFIFEGFKAAGFFLTEEDYERYIEKEVLMQQQVTGQQIRRIQGLSDHPLPIHNMNQALIQRDEQIAHLNNAAMERDKYIASLVQTMSEREVSYQQTLNGIWNSTSWRLTKPVRYMGKQWRWLKSHLKR